MKRYELSTPRTAFALTAVALTAMTLALSVFVPARVNVNAAPAETTIADAPTRVERIDVVAVRQSKVASTQGRMAHRRQHEG
jgi:hypothetical protein